MPRLDHYWQSINGLSLSLFPLSLVFAAVAGMRRLAYRLGLFRVRRFPVPVLVVGNTADLTAGGQSGKAQKFIG